MLEVEQSLLVLQFDPAVRLQRASELIAFLLARLGRVELGGITQHNIKILKRLNQMIFPVNYNEKFYKYVLKAGELAKLAYYNEMIVGAVCCRVEENSDNKNLYIMTLGCLAMYRRLGRILAFTF